MSRCGILLAAALAVGTAAAADPYVGYVYPSGIRVGATNRVIVGGQFFGGCRNAFVSGKGVRVIEVEHVPNFPNAGSGGQARYLTNWLKAIAEGRRERPPIPADARLDEWRSNSWWSVLGDLDDQKRALVERALCVRRNALQDSPSLRQRLLVTIVADPDAVPGVREFRLYGPKGVSEPRPFEVTAAPRREEPLYAGPFRAQPPMPEVAKLPTVLDGEIMPGETDSWRFSLTTGRPVTFRVRAREFQPYVGDAVPGFFNPVLRLLDSEGREVAFADDYFYHPDPVLTFVPQRTGTYVLEVRDALYRGREDFVYSVAVAEGMARPDVRTVSVWPQQDFSLPKETVLAAFDGTVSRPGTSVRHVLDVPAPGEYVLDLLARRTGSPLDARVTVAETNGQVLAVFTDVTNAVYRGTVAQGECDPVGRVRFDRAGRYALTVTDEQGKGGPEWTYLLRVHRPAPRFEAWLSPSSAALRPGERRAAKLTLVRQDGFAGAVRLRATPELKFVPDLIPASSNVMSVSVVSTSRGFVGPLEVPLFAEAVDGSCPRVRVKPADEYNQAFAWDHLLPAQSFIFCGYPRLGKNAQIRQQKKIQRKAEKAQRKSGKK